MRPTFLGFESAKRGIMAHQKALDITGHNLNNVNTPGYTRQRVDFVSVSPSTYRQRLAYSRTDYMGQGVAISGVAQTRDKFLDKRFRDEYGDVGYYDQYSAIMSDIESALDEFESDTGIKNAIKEIYTSLNNFSINADSTTHANIVATAFKNMTQVLHQFNTKLDNVAEQQKYSLEIAVGDVNDMLRKVAELNKTISEDIGTIGTQGDGSYGSNELLDERNMLLDELARYANIDVKENTDSSVTIKMNGHTVVDGKDYENINYQRNNNGTVSLSWQSTGKNVNLATGALKASVDLINGRGPGAISSNEAVDKGVLYYKDRINSFASTFASVMNKIIPETNADGNIMTDASGNIIYKTLLGARTQATDAAGNPIEGEYVTSTSIPTTAENISLSDEWIKDSSYIIFKDGDKAPTYINQMINALTKDNITFNNRGDVFTGTFEDFINDYVQTYGAEGKYSIGRFEASAAIADDLLNRRDSISGINPDEETSAMLMYNKSYQAASRLMTTLDEALDILINRTGLVGR